MRSNTSNSPPAPAGRSTVTGLARSGVAASIVASLAFAAIFVLARELDDFGALALYAWRVAISVIVIGVVFSLGGHWPLTGVVVRRLRAAPALIPVLVANAAFFGFQLWLFGWAPQAGRALEVALGYLLMPLVLVTIGIVLHRDPVSPLRAGALGAAAIGVAAAVFLAGGIGWPTAAVFVGYPMYFASRREAGLDSMGVVPLEFAVMAPVALVVLAFDADATAPLAKAPQALGILVLGLLSAAAFLAYLRASQVLPFSTFGLLGYLEPILLVAVATLVLGETLTADELLVYGPILAGLALLALDVRRSPEPPT